MKPAVFHRLAEQDLDEAQRFYEARSAGLGARLLTEAKQALEMLARYPEAAPRVAGPVRRFSLSTFPYSILYRTLADGRIRVLAVAHQKRHPKYGRGRR